MRTPRVLLFLSMALAACGSDSNPPAGADAGPELLEPPPPAGGQQLATTPYTLQPGEEKYLCWTFTSPDTMVGVTHVQNISGKVVHHVALFRSDGTEPTGEHACTGTVKLTWRPIWAAGAGSNSLDTPAGTAFKIDPGTQYVLQLHLQNVTDAPVTERSGLNLTYVDPTGLQTVNIFAIGQFQLDIPTGAMGFEQSTSCTAPQQLHVFAAFPHMHKLGKKLEFDTGADAASAAMAYQITPWQFGNQPFDPVDLTINQGDYLRATCTWDNTTGHDVMFGESSDDEMCIFVLYAYPLEEVSGCGF
jgi:hypothetical protein